VGRVKRELFQEPTLWVRTKHRLGLAARLHTEGRKIFENTVLTTLARDESFQRILFVGCEWYTRHYGDRYFRGREFWTIEFDEERSRRYGGELRVTDGVENVAEHFPPERFDLIICNGVFGWGLDTRDQAERAFRGCHELLRPGGLFVLGWNDVDGHRPFDPADTDALQAFDRYTFPPFGSWRRDLQTENRGILDFFVKPTT
jgi:hypothetical protein